MLPLSRRAVEHLLHAAAEVGEPRGGALVAPRGVELRGVLVHQMRVLGSARAAELFHLHHLR